MKLFGKLSFALVLLIGVGTTHVYAQDKPVDPPLHPGGLGPVEPAYNVTLHTSSMLPLDTRGSWSTLNIDMRTGAYTVQQGGNMDHMIVLKSMGTLSGEQMEAVQKAMTTTADAKLPSELPSAPVDGASQFTLSWEDALHLKNGSVSGVDNAKAAVEGQPANVKALWKSVTPLLDKMSTLEADFVKNHPYQPMKTTVEDDASKPGTPGKDVAKSVDLGHLDKPGTEFTAAAQKAGLISGGDLSLAPGQKVSFTTDRNQINGIADMKSSNPDVTVTSKIVKNMNPGQLGDESTVQWTIELSPSAKNSATAEITATGDYQSRNDPAYNFKIGVAAQAAQPIAKTADAATDDGVTDAIRNRGKTSADNTPRTGMDRLIDDKMDDNAHPERAAGDK